MKGEVIELDPQSNPDNILEAAKGRLECAIVIGVNENNSIEVSCSNLPPTEIVYLLEKCKLIILDSEY